MSTFKEGDQIIIKEVPFDGHRRRPRIEVGMRGEVVTVGIHSVVINFKDGNSSYWMMNKKCVELIPANVLGEQPKMEILL